MASNPPTRGSDSIHSEPTCRRTVRSLHPANAPRLTAAPRNRVRRSHHTRYLIVNEHVPREKPLRSATRIPRHYLIAEPPEILELYPHNGECFAPQNAKCQQRSHGPHISHLTQDWDEEHLKGRRRRQDHCFHADCQSHFYIGERIQNLGPTDKGKHNIPRRYGKAKEEDGVEEMDHLGAGFNSSVTEEDGLQLYLVRQSPVRSKHLKKTKIRAKQETQTESDSASLGSSSDQQNSSPDQYIQVIHNRPDAYPSKMPQKGSKTSFQLNRTESHDLVCSNV
ncbi:unnamed protein product [Tetraodon nigroviridis]|uniref:(spotted green pufferfish) hypothetical protein n=1 Tax=Tetraodon nigroviridis TaxID=99883 RepID=Q4STR7_TETNG|nr:unnamed protein product [Tetraodon nigroviridis]